MSPALLAKLLAEDFTGAVEVAGTPGGTVHLRRGLVVAVDTPNAPSVETLLIRSGRIDEASWAGAISYQAAVAMPDGSEEGGLNPVLTELRLIGQGELEAICVAALYNAAFAMALSPAEGWTVHKGAAPPALVSLPGESPRKLADETTRRIAVLSRSWSSLGELAAARCRPAARIDPGLLTARQQAVFAGGERPANATGTSRSSWVAGYTRRCSTSRACGRAGWCSGRRSAPRFRRVPRDAPHRRSVNRTTPTPQLATAADPRSNDKTGGGACESDGPRGRRRNGYRCRRRACG